MIARHQGGRKSIHQLFMRANSHPVAQAGARWPRHGGYRSWPLRHTLFTPAGQVVRAGRKWARVRSGG